MICMGLGKSCIRRLKIIDMKNSLIISVLLGVTIRLLSNSSILISDNSHEKKGRCTGSSYCTACSNCSRCGHCSSGGSCGVCESRSFNKRTTYTPHKNYKTLVKNKRKKTANSTKLKNNNGVLVVNKQGINIRKEPAINSIIIEKVSKNMRLIILQRFNSWYQIKVEKTGTIGYISHEDIK